MGMYTELQGTVVFKSEAIAKAFSMKEDQWGLISLMTGLDSVSRFKDHSRSHWIPGEVRMLDGETVQFHSELKNYDSTIEAFLNILPVIADDWTLESKYEECSEWTLHRKGFEDIRVNGDNYRETSWYGKEADEFYPTFDVFAL